MGLLIKSKIMEESFSREGPWSIHKLKQVYMSAFYTIPETFYILLSVKNCDNTAIIALITNRANCIQKMYNRYILS